MTDEMHGAAEASTDSKREIERLRQEVVDLRESLSAFREAQARTVLYLTEMQALMEGDMRRLRLLARIVAVLSDGWPGRMVRGIAHTLRRRRRR